MDLAHTHYELFSSPPLPAREHTLTMRFDDSQGPATPHGQEYSITQGDEPISTDPTPGTQSRSGIQRFLGLGAPQMESTHVTPFIGSQSRHHSQPSGKQRAPDALSIALHSAVASESPRESDVLELQRRVEMLQRENNALRQTRPEVPPLYPGNLVAQRS
ncbi:hypothetical protein H0H87_006983 [Tephrocybe sp. NHM501043]|nr:hypothetical protein H0H87_006983 [Tephrocybe sp. NHM501043]